MFKQGEKVRLKSQEELKLLEDYDAGNDPNILFKCTGFRMWKGDMYNKVRGKLLTVNNCGKYTLSLQDSPYSYLISWFKPASRWIRRK